MVLCAAFGCNSRSEKDNVSFFQFPKDERLRKTWLEKLNRGKTSTQPFEPTPHHKLCSKHFHESQFRISHNFAEQIGFASSFRIRLKEDAIPTIFDGPEKQPTSERASAQRIGKKKFEEIASVNKCSNPLHGKWGNNDTKLIMASTLSSAVITIFRHLDYERSSGCMFCETCVNKATEVAEMDKSQGSSVITVSDDSNDKSDSRSSSASKTTRSSSYKIRKQCEQAQIQVQLDRLATLDIDEEEKASRAKQLRMLAFVNPGKFMEDFDPETSAREMKKMNRKILKEKTARKNQLYDDNGWLLCNNKNLCDCLDMDCPGCHFPCPRCRSEKCGGECRCNRRWVYDHIEVEGTNTVLSWNFDIKPPGGQ